MFGNSRRVYLDYAATTPVRPEVMAEMSPYFTEQFGNASTSYGLGREAFAAITKARQRVAQAIGALPEEIVFTSGGTESDNFAIKGVAFAAEEQGHIITSAIEHSAVIETCEFLEQAGWAVTYLPVDRDGLLDVEELEKAITPKTALISVMTANNEIGVIQPIQEIGRIAKARGIPFHTDGVQAMGTLAVNVNDWGVDLMAMSGHKIYGPKGVGASYIRKGTVMAELIHGGSQERHRRAGTENVPGIVGFGKAMELAAQERASESSRLQVLRDHLIQQVCSVIDRTHLNGHPIQRLPHNVNIRIEGVDSMAVNAALDMSGICASRGSACSTGAPEPSNVLLAIGLTKPEALGSLRFSLGKQTTREDLDFAVQELASIVKRARQADRSAHGTGGAGGAVPPVVHSS